MDIICICMVVQVRRLGEITKWVKVNGEEVRGWSFGLLGEMMRDQQMKLRKSSELGRELREVLAQNLRKKK